MAGTVTNANVSGDSMLRSDGREAAFDSDSQDIHDSELRWVLVLWGKLRACIYLRDVQLLVPDIIIWVSAMIVRLMAWKLCTYFQYALLLSCILGGMCAPRFLEHDFKRSTLCRTADVALRRSSVRL